MEKEGLIRLMAGIYMDDLRNVWVDMHEFLTANGIPDEPRLRLVAWSDLLQKFAGIRVYPIPAASRPVPQA